MYVGIRRQGLAIAPPLHKYLATTLSEASDPGIWKVACLRESRGVIRLKGPGLLHLLQGLITNDASGLEAPDAKPLYGCILTPQQGRYAHDMMFHREPGTEPSLLVDTDRRGKEDLVRLLKRYRMHQKIDIEDVSDDYSVWVKFGSHLPAPSPGGWWHQDPRLPELGLRTVVPNAEVEAAGGAGAGLGGGAEEVSWRAYRRWRILQGVAEGDSEIPSGSAVPAEYNLSALNAFSFDKGCYVGQEFVARVHFKGVVRKRLMPFRVDPATPGSCCLDPGSQVCDVFDAAGALNPVGAVRAREGDVGLALLRLQAGVLAAAAREPLYARCGGAGQYVAVRPWRPRWWPPEWGQTAQELGGEEEEAGTGSAGGWAAAARG